MSDLSHAQRYRYACDAYAALGVDVEQALDALSQIPLSLPCWQGDGLRGFESPAAKPPPRSIAEPMPHPGRARNADELRADLDTALSLIPGKHRLTLHAIYLESRHAVPRDELGMEHFSAWVDWAKEHGMGLDLNPTFFAHPLSEDGFTLSHEDCAIRAFWVRHLIACRRIAAGFGKALGSPSILNTCMVDGYTDQPIDRLSPRQRLAASLDEALAEKLDPAHMLDAVESRRYGMQIEDYTVGTHEFFLGYAATRQTLLCLGMGDFHPTECIGDKVSAYAPFVPGFLLHLGRPVRRNCDPVVSLDDALRRTAAALISGRLLPRAHLGLQCMDPCINAVAAWVLGVRNVQKALLSALLLPLAQLSQAELDFDLTTRQVLMEEAKTLPFLDVWNEFCLRHNAPEDGTWLRIVQDYERRVMLNRA